MDQHRDTRSQQGRARWIAHAGLALGLLGSATVAAALLVSAPSAWVWCGLACLGLGGAGLAAGAVGMRVVPPRPSVVLALAVPLALMGSVVGVLARGQAWGLVAVSVIVAALLASVHALCVVHPLRRAVRTRSTRMGETV